MKRVPSFFTLIAISFWGINIGHPLFAILLAIFLETPNLFRIDVDFKYKAFQRSSFFSLVLLLIISYFYIKTNPLYIVGGVIKWSPLILFPIISTQIYSKERKTPIKALLLFAKDSGLRKDLLWLYLGLTLLASASGDSLLPYYYIYSYILVVLALFIVKPKRYSIFIWIIIVSFLSVVAFGVESGVSILHKKAVDKAVEWLVGGEHTNLWKTNSAIGDIGNLKESNRIIYRLKPKKGDLPKYLRRATYLLYNKNDWFTDRDKFSDIEENLCNHGYYPEGSFTLTGSFNKEELLSIPSETISIEENNSIFQKNSFYSIKRVGKSGYHNITINYNNNQYCDKAIQKKDFKIPRVELPAIDYVIDELGLKDIKDEKVVLSTLESFFQDKFTYSLKLIPKGRYETSLTRFLIGDRKGHCEYFATATTLILRRLGFVARYTIGYSVQEYSRLENQYIIRSRHGHAWVRVMTNDNHWINFDTTPYGWSDIESENFSIFYKIYDFFSWINYKFAKLGVWNMIKSNFIYILVVLTLLFIFLRRGSYKREEKLYSQYPLKGSIIIKIDKILFKKDVERDKTIPFLTWLNSLSQDDGDKIKRKKLFSIISKYYDLRFTSKLDKNNIESLKREIKDWKKII